MFGFISKIKIILQTISIAINIGITKFKYIYATNMPKLAPYLLCICIAFFCARSYAQQPAYTYYNVRDGLASNDIYNCVEDKKGFLWVATENGVSRFDGVSFKNYNISNGLPDNDVILVEMDSSGTIWALPFQQSPAYYDYNTDKFINSNTNAILKQVTSSGVVNANALSNGGIAFCKSNGIAHIIKNNQCLTYQLTTYKNINRVIAMPNNNFCAIADDSIINIKTNAAYYFSSIKKSKRTAYLQNQLYVADSNTLLKITINNNGSLGHIIKNILPFRIINLNYTGKQIAVASGTGNIYFADTASLQISPVGLSFSALIRYVYEDKAGNTWICTRESGLIRYQQKGILSLKEKEFSGNFNTLCFWKNKLVAGTNQGQFVIYNGPYNTQTIYLNNEQNFNTWIRQLKVYNDKLFIIAEGGLFNYEKTLVQNTIYTSNGNIANKAFVMLNDTIAIAGNSTGVRKINYNTLKTSTIEKIRVTCLEAASNESVYVGSNSGLYLWQNCVKLVPLQQDKILSKRVNTIAYNKADSLLWVGLAYDTIVALQHNKIVLKIPLNNVLRGNECRKIYSTQKGIAWVGTNAILAKIAYGYHNSTMQYSIATFSTADGIAGNQINDIAVHNDTVYVATNTGISFLPQALKLKIADAPIYITSVKINNKDTALQSSYALSYKTYSIAIYFTSPDLSSSAERMYEYQINNGAWQKTTVSKIELPQLAPNNYTIKIRPYNKDGKVSLDIATIQFKIKAPFYKTSLFIILLLLIIIGSLFYFLQRQNKIKRERTIQQILAEKKLTDLELKALKAQINPHFVFNCLNSIKYLNHQKKFEETDLYLDKFSYLLRKTLDFSGLQKITLQEELLYSKNYLELEKLRLGYALQFDIATNKNLNAATTLVPPMLLQPYLENAIKHGIRHLPKNTKGQINIFTKIENNTVVCTVEDNGVGINHTINFNKINQPHHISHGTALQQRRADLYNVQVQILTPTNSQGTLIKLTLPYETTT